MRFRPERSPIYVVGFLLTLFLPQAVALGLQFARGFRPFVHEPVRVPLSWDMFANRVERCVMEFNRTTRRGNERYLPLRLLGERFEWDVVLDSAADYRGVSQMLCRAHGGVTRIRLHCFLPNGEETREELRCE